MDKKLKKRKQFPRSFDDYDLAIDESVVPKGVELLKFPEDMSKLD